MATSRFDNWKAAIMCIGGDFDLARIRIIASFLLDNEFFTPRQLRRAADPTSWEGAESLRPGAEKC